MTETEWLSSQDPDAMLAFIRGRADDSKRRQFACACCSRVLHLIQDPRSIRALAVAERFAHGTATVSELRGAAADALDAAAADGDNGQDADAVAAASDIEVNEVAAAHAAAWAKANSVGDAANIEQSAYDAIAQEEFNLERGAQAHLLRSIVGNPFSKPGV